MPTKEGGGNQQQQYDKATGRFIANGGGNTKFKSFAKPKEKKDFSQEINELKSKASGLSLFNPERRAIMEKVKDLEAQMNGYENAKDELKHIQEQNEARRKRQEEIRIQQEQEKQKRAEEFNKEIDPHKKAQFDIIQEYNPMTDEYHTGIRSVNDIKTFEEALKDDEPSYPDFTKEDGEKALKDGYITIYSSKPIVQGNFITPSLMQAKEYAGGKQVYSKKIKLDEVAWINPDEGQYAKIIK